MERSEQYEDIAVALAEVRPAPRADFAAELDGLVAAGFPRRSRFGSSPLAALAARLRAASPQRLLFASGSAALAAIAIATVVVASSGSTPEPVARESAGRPEQLFSEPVPKASSESVLPSVGSSGQHGSAETESSKSAEAHNGALSELHGSIAAYAPLSRAPGRATHRDIERSAEIGLLADPADVADDSAKVFSAVHDAGGIVLHSTTTAGSNAGADFDLLIPSAKLGDALAAFSAIDEVRTRHEATADITAPAVALGERLRDSQARIKGLLSQLSAAETESESEAIGFELRDERRHAARLRARLSGLHRRTSFSRVSVRIESGASSGSGGSWGIDDAFGDAGHVLGVAAGVTVVGLAVLAPLALVAFLAWLAHRLWLRTRRERALRP